MTRPLDDLLPKVLTYVRNVPEPVAIDHLRDACRMFCKRTKAWRETDSMVITAPEYQALLTITDAAILTYEDPFLDTMELTPISVADLNKKAPGWSTDTVEASATYVTQLLPNTLSIYPRQTGTLTAMFVLQPTGTALEIPDFLFNDHATQLGWGAAATILELPGTEYANPKMSDRLGTKFEDYIAEQSTVVRKGQQGARLRTTPSWF